MGRGRILLFTLTILLSLSNHAQIVERDFAVSLSGDLNYLKSFQLRAELKLARSTDFCRGFTIPSLKGKWSCERVGGGEAKCKGAFTCAMIKKGFSRKSETIRLSRAIKNLGLPKKKFSMIVSKRPFKNIDRYKLAKEVEEQRKKAILDNQQKAIEKKRQEQALLQKQIKLRANRLKNEMVELDEFSQLEQELDEATQRNKTDASIADSRIETVEQLEAEAMAADEREMSASQRDVLDTNSSDEDSDELAQLEVSDESSSNEPQSRESRWTFLSFGAGMFSISDEEENSVTTFGIMWSPLWKLTRNWDIKGNLSWHRVSAVVETGEEAESFNIIEIGAQLEWRVFEEGLYLSLGYGIQNWGSSVGGSFSALSIGGGYYFEKKKDRLIDYLFVKQVSVSNETSNVELVGGLGFIF